VGQHAVAAWLRSPPAGVELEAEAIVRVWFGHLGSKEDLVTAIDAVQDQAEAALRHGVRIGHARLAAMPTERGHVAALVFRFLWDYNSMLAKWATWANEEIEDWSDTAPTLESSNARLRSCASAWRMTPEIGQYGLPGEYGGSVGWRTVRSCCTSSRAGITVAPRRRTAPL
jgi:hypothetical protein